MGDGRSTQSQYFGMKIIYKGAAVARYPIKGISDQGVVFDLFMRGLLISHDPVIVNADQIAQFPDYSCIVFHKKNLTGKNKPTKKPGRICRALPTRDVSADISLLHFHIRYPSCTLSYFFIWGIFFFVPSGSSFTWFASVSSMSSEPVEEALPEACRCVCFLSWLEFLSCREEPELCWSLCEPLFFELVIIVLLNC